MGGYNKETMRKVLVVLLVLVIAGAVAQVVYINVFNQRVHTVSGADSSQESYLDLHNRGDSTSAWVKRDYDLRGKKVDIWAQTLDGTFYNNSTDEITSWKLRIDIEKDCFINNAWCGTMEIHQNVGTRDEIVQTLDLRSYNVDDVRLEHLYDGDLLIPLTKGDYLVYSPSEKDGELPIAPESELTMGLIFYYLDSLDLSSYTLEYLYHRDFTYGPGFIAVVVFAILWLLLLIGSKVADLSYKRAMKDMELRKSGLASMSSIYSIISYIDLDNDELIPVYSSDQTVGKPLKGAEARRQILEVFDRDTADSHHAAVMKFVDTSTLEQRMDKESIACEYVSKAFGWSQIRFFAVDRAEDGHLERVLFTIQDINDEKRELERFAKRADQAEFVNKTVSSFVSGVLNGMSSSIQAIRDTSDKIHAESGDEPIRTYAKQVERRGKMLASMVDSAIDCSALAAGNLELTSAEYSFQEMVATVGEIADVMRQDNSFTYETNISPSIPDRLVGDARRIEQLLIALFAYAIRHAENGIVKLSAYGKAHEGLEHILFSVKVSGSEMGKDELKDLEAFVSNMEGGTNHAVIGSAQELEAVALLLAFMGSKLQVINEPGEGSEFYFEIEQKIAEAV